MARAIHTRWKINGVLQAETPIHVGGVGGDADTDLALAVNGRGQYYIPGTSLAGALRGWMSQPFHNGEPTSDNDRNSLKHPENPVNQLWGFQGNEQGYASLIVIDDSEIDGTPEIEIREGVGIDRHTGAAANQEKYNRTILPKGVTFPLNITLDLDHQKHQTPDELWQLLVALEKGDIRIGAAKTRGLGQVKLTISSIYEQKFDANHIFEVLLHGGKCHQWNDIKNQYQPESQYRGAHQLKLNIPWQPKDPVMVKSEGEGIAVDILPLVSQANDTVYFVIPGSSIKGVLRAQAERIVRTVCQKETPDQFLDQVEVNLVNELFGSAEKSNTNQTDGEMGALSVDDCYAKIPITPEQWGNVENAAKDTNETFSSFKNTLHQALAIPNNSNENPFHTLQPAMHVAVDRWTGSAADGMLYSVLEPIGVDWDHIAIHLDLRRLQKYDANKVKPAIALLFLVLRDFAARKIPIGYGTNRGMGTVEVTNPMTMTCTPIDGLEGFEEIQELAPDLSNINEDLLLDLNDSWIDWINNNQEVK